MNILFFSRLFYPHIGGVEKHVLEIGRRLVKDGHSVTVVTENHSWKAVETVEGIKVYRVDVGNWEFLKKFRIWFWLLKNIKIIKKANIVHCHDIFIWYLPFAIRFPLKNTFTTFHGYEGNKIPGFKAKLMHKIAEKMSNANICVGAFLEKWYGTKATYITYGAVTRIKNQESRIKSKNLNVKIVFVGRLEEETGIMDYLEAVKILFDKGHKISLTVLGDGSQRKQSEEFAKKEKLNIQFLGFVKNTEKFVQNAQIVFTSRYLGILETLMHKKYIFSVYNNEIKKDYLSMTPFAKYISINSDANDIADSFETMLKNKKQTEEKISKGYEYAKKQTWDKLVGDYKKLWKI